MGNVIGRAFGELNNILLDEFNKTLFEMKTSVRFFLSHGSTIDENKKMLWNLAYRGVYFPFGLVTTQRMCTHEQKM